MPVKDCYQVHVVGFNPTERALLSSVFALAARRDPGFAQADPAGSDPPDLYLVDVDDPSAYAEFRTLRARAPLPAILVGADARGTGLAIVARPIQWARLLQALDDLTGAELGDPLAALGLTSEDLAAADRSRNLSRPQAGSSSGTAPRRTQNAGKRKATDSVLVVDDNATVRSFMQAKLEPYGFEIDIAASGEEAVGMTGGKEYTCVFLDVVLPGIDGYQVCKLIKSNKNAVRKTAVVMLTSRSSPFDKLRGSLAGCDEYLTKPLDEDRLLEVIAKFLPNAR